MSSLAERKAAVRRRIAAGRKRYTAATRRVVEPFRWIDDAMKIWQRLPPVARSTAIPSLLLLVRAFFPRVRSLLRWSPALLGLWRFFRALRRKPAPPAAAA